MSINPKKTWCDCVMPKIEETSKPSLGSVKEYKSGGVVFKKHNRTIIIKAFWYQYKDLLSKRLDEFIDLKNNNQISDVEFYFISQYADVLGNQVINVLENKNTGQQPILEYAENAQKILQNLTRDLQILKRSGGLKYKRLENTLQKLAEDISHFTLSIEYTKHAIFVNKSGDPLHANRPVRIDAKATFFTIMSEHQNIHGRNSFPRPKSIKAILKARGFVVSDRTLYDWKIDYQNAVLKIGNKSAIK